MMNLRKMTGRQNITSTFVNTFDQVASETRDD